MSLLVQSSHNMRIDTVKRYIGVLQELASGFIRRGFSFIFPCIYFVHPPCVLVCVSYQFTSIYIISRIHRRPHLEYYALSGIYPSYSPVVSLSV